MLLKLSLFNIDHTKEPAKYGVNWVHWNPCPWDQELPRQEAEGGVGRRGPAARRMRCKCTDTGLLLPALQSSRGISHPPPFQKLGNSFHFYSFFPPSGSSSGINSSFTLFFFLFLFFFLPPLQSFFFKFYFIVFLLLSAKLQKLCFENCCPRVQLLSCPVSIVLMLIPYVCHIGAVPSSSSSSSSLPSPNPCI